MVNFGVPLSSTTFSRVSSVLSSNVILSNLRRQSEEFLRLQEQLASGFLINRPSDDPVGSNKVLNFNSHLARNDQFQRNIQSARSRLLMSEQSLAAAEEILIRARETFLTERNDPSDASSRELAASEIQLLIDNLLTEANARFEGRNLFGGSRTAESPFAALGADIVFRGDLEELRTEVADGLRSSTNVLASAFGALSDGILGRDATTFLPIDLDPVLAGSTRLADLHGGRGVQLGSIQILATQGPVVQATIDLTDAKDMTDVLQRINAQSGTTGVTAAINAAGDGIDLTGIAAVTNIEIQEVTNGRTAQDLGILTVPGGVANPPGVAGSDLDPRITKDTLVGDLLSGAGLDSSGIVITNQSSSQTLTETFGASVFAATATVEQVLLAINQSSAQVHARINDQGTGIDIHSRLSGAFMSISENGGTTAAQMGLLTTLSRSRLVDLNGGNGIGTVVGDDIRITKHDGTTVTFDLDNAVTVNDLVALINTDADLTATLTALDEIEIVDASVGPGAFTINNLNGSFAATNLGIEGTGVAGTLTGTPVTPAGVQVEGLFTSLLRLRNSLRANDVGAMDSAANTLETAEEILLEARGALGSRVAAIELTRNRLEFENTELEKLRSEVRDADLAEVATRFSIHQTVLQASLATAARVLETTLFNHLR